MLIELREITKKYGRLRALDRVSLQIEPGQIVSILGANGAGKTTLLRSLAGVITPSSGEILYDTEVFHRDRIHLRKQLMFLPDFPVVFSHYNMLQHIGMVVNLYGVDHALLQNRILDLISEFDLLPIAKLPLGTLSRGQIYKAALIALLAVSPDVWLLDEPLASGMDPHGISAFKRHARQAASNGKTILYSTQLLDLAEHFSDRVCVIHRARVHAFDRVENLRGEASGHGVLEELFGKLREEL